jgi:hypothetical protein
MRKGLFALPVGSPVWRASQDSWDTPVRYTGVTWGLQAPPGRCRGDRMDEALPRARKAEPVLQFDQQTLQFQRQQGESGVHFGSGVLLAVA